MVGQIRNIRTEGTGLRQWVRTGDGRQRGRWEAEETLGAVELQEKWELLRWGVFRGARTQICEKLCFVPWLTESLVLQKPS